MLLEPALSALERVLSWTLDVGRWTFGRRPLIESATGPGSLMLIDPDGNPILIDQHVDSLANMKK